MRTKTSAFGASKVNTNFGFASDVSGKHATKLDLPSTPMTLGPQCGANLPE